MSRARPGSGGFTLVEVLVALVVLTINGLAVSGLLVAAIDLTRRVEAIASAIEEGVALPACALMLVPRARRRRARPTGRAGFTLVEILVALALAGVLLATAIAFLSGGTRAAAGLTERAIDQEARLAMPAIIAELVATAGAGVPASTCALGVTLDRRTLVLVRADAEGVLRVEEVFAASDGGGRPALYLRHRPYARQPWLEDVVAFEVLGVREATDGRADAIELRLEHRAAYRPLDLEVRLPHRPCLADAS